jgi:hypothetical protein
LSDVANEPILTDIESGAAQLLSTATAGGLSNLFDSAQGGWINSPQPVEPFTSVAVGGGKFDWFRGGPAVDPSTNDVPADANPNNFTDGHDVYPFTEPRAGYLAQNDEPFSGSGGVIQIQIYPNFSLAPYPAPAASEQRASPAPSPPPNPAPDSASGPPGNSTPVDPEKFFHDLTPDERAALWAQWAADVGFYLRNSGPTTPAAPNVASPATRPSETAALYAPWAAGPFSSLAGAAPASPAAATAGSPAALPDFQPRPATAAPPTEPDWTTRTEWPFHSLIPGLFQPVTSVDTGNRPSNVVLNKFLLPWWNYLGATQSPALFWLGLPNIYNPFAPSLALGIFRLIDDALKHSAVRDVYEAAQYLAPVERAWGMAMEVGPALDYAWSGLSTNQSLRSLATAPAFSFTGAGGVGGGIPTPPAAMVGGADALSQTQSESGAAQQAVQALAPELATSLPPAQPSAGSVLIENSSRGRAFETKVRNAFSLPRNTRTMLGQTASGALRPTIPDVYAGGQSPMADIKDLLRLFLTGQLQAEDAIAGWTRASGMTGSSFNIIVGPRNLTISAPLFDAVQASGGFIFRVDPEAMTVEVLVDRASRAWVPFLGGSWGF